MSTVPYLILIDADGNTYNFPPSFWLYDIPWDKTTNMEHISFAHGGHEKADAYLNARSITIQGDLRADSVAALETLERSFKKAIFAGGKLYVSDDSVSRYITVGSVKVTESFIGDYRTEKKYTVNYLAEYPFWEANAASTVTQVLAAGLTTVTVDNSASDILASPQITITADQAADPLSVMIVNRSDGAMTFQYVNANFKNGDVLVIDSKLGTVMRNGNSDIAFVTKCLFPRLQNLSNSIEVTVGGACTLLISWRKVYV